VQFSSSTDLQRLALLGQIVPVHLGMTLLSYMRANTGPAFHHLLIQVEVAPQGTRIDSFQLEEASGSDELSIQGGPLPTFLGQKRRRSAPPPTLTTASIPHPSSQPAQFSGTPVKPKLLKKALAPATPEHHPEQGSASHSKPAEFADIVDTINEPVGKCTVELQNSDCLDVPPELSLFMQVCPTPVPGCGWPYTQSNRVKPCNCLPHVQQACF
jgi:hypothetical protein